MLLDVLLEQFGKKVPDDDISDTNLFLLRLIMAFVLHLEIHDKYVKGLDMMKFALNHPWRFNNWKAAVMQAYFKCFVLGMTEIINLVNLLYQKDPQNIVVGYLRYGAVVKIDNFVFHSLNSDIFHKMTKASPDEQPEALTVQRTSSNKNSWSG